MLQPPEFYLDGLKAHIERHRAYWGGKCEYTGKWRLELTKKTNRHPTTRGYRWGWYEISPLGIEVGFWEDGGKDDLKGVDINQWNALARELNI